MISILVLEENSDLSMSMLETLGRLDANVLMALSVDSAEQLLKENTPPDLILLNLKLPDRSGYKLLEMIRGGQIIPNFDVKLIFFKTLQEYEAKRREHNNDMAIRMKQIPVIIITAANSAEDVLKGKNLGVSDYILKPADPERVLRKIADCMLRHLKLP